MNILAISPHTDDVELGAGASVVRWLEEGHTIISLALSTGLAGMGSNADEHRAALGVLGIKCYVLQEFGCTRFFERRADILNFLIKFRGRYDPFDLVLVPNSGNVHEDHVVITTEAVRAFRTSSIIGYEMPWGDIGPFKAQMFVKVEVPHLMTKVQAINCYESQRVRRYTDMAVISAQATLRGAQVDTAYAEAFEVIRWVQ